MNHPSNRIDPRILRTRQLLKEAFIELMQEKAVEKITVHSLAERAMVNRVTFYLHYRDIPDLLEKISKEMIQELHGILGQLTESETPNDTESRCLLLVKILEHIAENAMFYKAVLATQHVPAFTERLLLLLSELIEMKMQQQKKPPDSSVPIVRKDIATWYASSALIGVIVCWLRNDMPYTPGFLARQFFLLRHSTV